MLKVLFVGQKPETVDFSDPALPRASTPRKSVLELKSEC